MRLKLKFAPDEVEMKTATAPAGRKTPARKNGPEDETWRESFGRASGKLRSVPSPFRSHATALPPLSLSLSGHVASEWSCGQPVSSLRRSPP